MIYFPFVYKTIPVNIDDSMSYYAQLIAIASVIEKIQNEITTIEETLNTIDDKILKEVKEELSRFKSELEKELQDLKNAVNIEITSLRDDVEKAINAQDNKWNKLLNDNIIFINSRLNEQDIKISDYEKNMKYLVENLEISFSEKLTILRNEFFDLTKSINGLYTYIDEQDKVYWDKLKEYCDKLYTRRSIYYVKNPITKRVDEINKTLQLLYYICNNAISCDEYNFLDLTCDEYSKLKLTCIEYLKTLKDLYNKKYFTSQVSFMNPYTGKIENVVEVVKQLVKFHEEIKSLTAYEYKALNLSADQYFEKNTNAYDYYTSGKKIFL